MPLADAAKRSRSWACYDCGKCTATCPISRVGSTYSPRRHVLAANSGARKEVLANGTLANCLTCSQCDARCPADVAYTELVMRLRELSFREGVEPECPHGGALQSLMRMMARGEMQQDRMGWVTEDLEIVPEKGTVFYWTGCTMYYDAFFPEYKIETLEGTRAAVRLLNRLGIKPVVSREERCCGHDLLWNGDVASFEKLAKHNVELVTKSGAETVVTSCAECLRTWRIDYAPYFTGTPPKVVHIAELLSERMPELQLKEDGAQKVTFQDPCRMGRHLGIYDAPRQVLVAIPGVELKEMRRSRQSALCCAGGTWSNCDRFAKKIQVDRLHEARSTGAEFLVTACPKCQIHFRCAMQDPNQGDEIRVELCDVAQLVADRLT